jgi:glucose-6-phosphate 1-dehydrogenase
METKRKIINVCQETKVETKQGQSLVSKLMPRPSVSLKEFEKTKSVTTVVSKQELKSEMKQEDEEARELYEQI